MRFKLPADHEAVRSRIVKPVLNDSEGNPIAPEYITTRVNSSDSAVILPDLYLVDGTDPYEELSIIFGRSGVATVEIAWEYNNGVSEPVLVDSWAASFHLYPPGGPVTVVSGGGVSFPDLTPEPEGPPVVGGDSGPTLDEQAEADAQLEADADEARRNAEGEDSDGDGSGAGESGGTTLPPTDPAPGNTDDGA